MARPVRDTSETLKLRHDDSTSITMRAPSPADGHQMWQLAKDSGGLDLNSPYAYLLAGHHFASTSVVAEASDGRLAGFVFAYSPQDRPDTVFVWQVATHPDFRGLGIGKRMLHQVIDQALPRGVTSMTATVTPSNDASRSLFNAVARDRGTGCDEYPCFGAELFPTDEHEPEHEIYVGPFTGSDDHDR
jgi:L-2,4-diaminobutyric acid acetyltransferase